MLGEGMNAPLLIALANTFWRRTNNNFQWDYNSCDVFGWSFREVWRPFLQLLRVWFLNWWTMIIYRTKYGDRTEHVMPSFWMRPSLCVPNIFIKSLDYQEIHVIFSDIFKLVSSEFWNAAWGESWSTIPSMWLYIDDDIGMNLVSGSAMLVN